MASFLNGERVKRILSFGGGGSGPGNLVIGTDGWSSPGETWTYASATSFTVAGDVTGKYAIGDKIKLTQTTVKYFYIVGLSYGAPNTTITVAAGNVYSLANAAITDNFYSKLETPGGFPEWFTWTPTFTGYSANPTELVYRFKLQGRCVTLATRDGVAGTSNATTLTFTAPLTARNLSTGSFPMSWNGIGSGVDNGIAFAAPVRLNIEGNSNVVNAFRDHSGAAWTNSGSKHITRGFLTYEI